MNKIRILLADDHAIMRIGLSSLLSREKDITVAGEASDGEETVRLAHELRPDVVVMDLMMPKLNGADATQRIMSDDTLSPKPRVLIFTSYGQAADLAQAVLNGASGVLLKNSPTQELSQAIRRIAAGEQVLSKEIQRMVQEATDSTNLTERQHEILALAVRGYKNQEIANMMNLSLITIKKQFSDILSRLGATNRAEATAIAVRKHLISQ